MPTIIVYSKENCPYCVRAKQLLKSKNLAFQEIHVDQDPEKLEEMIQKSGRRTVPQIFINGKAIGGCDDLFALSQSGQLNDLLN